MAGGCLVFEAQRPYGELLGVVLGESVEDVRFSMPSPAHLGIRHRRAAIGAGATIPPHRNHGRVSHSNSGRMSRLGCSRKVKSEHKTQTPRGKRK